METTITTDTPPTIPDLKMSQDALQFLWLLRALHRKRGAEGLLDLAEHYERENDPRYADVPRLLRAIGEDDPSSERWDQTFRVAIAASEVR